MSSIQDFGLSFGTSGMRGLVSDLSDRACYAFTTAFLKCFAKEARSIIIGHDLRPSSPGITQACIAGIIDSGRDVVYVGALPTPAIAYHAALNALPALVVTGSHIPFDRNGIKFYRVDGEMTKEDEVAMMACEVEVPEVVESGALPDVEKRAKELYVQRYLEFFGPGALSGMRIAVYEHSSVARDVVREILEKLGAEVVSLGRTETFVPIDTEAVSPEDVAQAHEWAREVGFDAIVSTDGDGDRPLIGDEQGEWLRGDVVGILCAQYLGATAVVTPVSCNTAVESALLGPGNGKPESSGRSSCSEDGAFCSVQVVRTRIGSPYVIAGMEAVETDGVVVGYEANGGFLLGSDVERDGNVLKALPTRDAVLPMLVVLSMARERGCKVSEVTDWLPERYTASDRLKNVPSDWSQKFIGQLQGNPQEMRELLGPGSGEIVRVDMTDGLRVTFENTDIVHLRPSGNAPELRCYIEAGSVERARELCEGALGRLQRFIDTLEIY